MADQMAKIHYDDVVNRTPEAVCLLIERGDHGGPSIERWVPMSVIYDYTGDLLDSEDAYTGPGAIYTPLWYAEQEGLV